ncbi:MULTISPECIES: acyl-CoA dehydrogenase family protein [unclassified Brevibacterium]|uniref:acyl-CoA dehydrogenase family protein n=1 Tax=unclassified Brevibacterium TaxID=2614124 RepID=UPI001092D2CE|nr:acyl-CoA dehydrogenase family protein [Brevibacterium sp. S22]TGD32616.1 acyl-CoA dehydrogenase [Brevibacterium sp. S22]
MTLRTSWMDEELREFREAAIGFFERESLPHTERWENQQHVDRELWNKAGEAGLLCVSIPEEYGGGGGTFVHEAALAEAQAYAGDFAFGNHVHSPIVAHYLLNCGTEEQKKTWLPKLASGEVVGAIAMTEPGTGSDLQSISTKAKLGGYEYVVNGAKTFITNGHHAGLVLVVARTGGEGAKGLSLLLVDTTEAQGFSRGRVLNKIGMKGQDTAELFFDEMRVPAKNILGGEPSQGFAQLMRQLPQERLIIAATAMGAIERAIDDAVSYAKERNAFGRSLLEFQNTRFVLAECRTEADVARAFIDRCVEAHTVGKLDATDASQVKYWLTDKQGEIIDRCLQIFGGYGYMLEYPIARSYAAARVQRIYGGTNEIMKELIARSL